MKNPSKSSGVVRRWGVARVAGAGVVGDVAGAAGRLTGVDPAAAPFGQTTRRSRQLSSIGGVGSGLGGQTRRDSVRKGGGVEALHESAPDEYPRVVRQPVFGGCSSWFGIRFRCGQ